ncbi:unnamed protein product [Pleuronectes platessa]|uniref:Uncharacterized protein n=1 Tax=Pleuronectes platessa TaxID=8262 RepID=A0A9N7UPB1_PLEPL|nr:unnamed protein product [Pleuronectes platessa]
MLLWVESPQPPREAEPVVSLSTTRAQSRSFISEGHDSKMVLCANPTRVCMFACSPCVSVCSSFILHANDMQPGRKGGINQAHANVRSPLSPRAQPTPPLSGLPWPLTERQKEKPETPDGRQECAWRG